MTRIVRVERKDNCFASNSEKWSVRVHPHFAGQYVLGLDEDCNGEFNTVKTGTFQEVKTFAQEKFASVYEHDCSLQEILTNDDEYNQVFVSNETGEVYVDW